MGSYEASITACLQEGSDWGAATWDCLPGRVPGALPAGQSATARPLLAGQSGVPGGGAMAGGAGGAYSPPGIAIFRRPAGSSKREASTGVGSTAVASIIVTHVSPRRTFMRSGSIPSRKSLV